MNHPARHDAWPVRAWQLEAALTAVVVLLIAFGTLTPFAIKPNIVGLTLPGWPRAHFADVATNVVGYVPVGAMFAVLLRRVCPARSAVVLAVILATLMSFSLETAQSVIKHRYASWYDVITNGAGAACGAMAAIALADWVRSWLWYVCHAARRRPMEALSRLTGAAVVVYAVAPFDFVGTADALASRLRGARIPLLATIQAGRLIPEGPALVNPWHGPIDRHDVVLAGGLLLFGLLSARGGRSGGKLLAGIGAGWLLAVIIETLQLFCTQHAFDIGDLLLNGVAASVGAAVGAVFLRRNPPACCLSSLDRSAA